MSGHVFTDPDVGERIELPLPIAISLDLEHAKKELRIPDYVTVDNFAMKKTLAVLWLAKNLDKNGIEIEGVGTSPIPVALFGGVAFRFHCPTMNDPKSPVHRIPNDVDYAVLKEDGRRFTTVLQQASSKFGSGLFHWTYQRDRVFNGFRRGERYRLRCVAAIDDDGLPVTGVTDIICDTLSFCHVVPLRDAIKLTQENFYTIGLERMILSKTQFIKRVSRAQLTEEAKPRFLENFGATEVVLGMEPKDMRDVTAAFVDHDLGSSRDQINVEIIGKLLESNWGLRQTTLLNLANLIRVLSTDLLGLNQDDSKLAKERIQAVVNTVTEEYVAKRPRFSFSSEWWESVDEGRT
ncbi:MAG TPA: hypothetical protein VEH56_08535 [Candidatus Saccharimonadales bacterium]|nr:hypothetical protein [Candidatus Saccharimonadales bacterium]